MGEMEGIVCPQTEPPPTAAAAVPEAINSQTHVKDISKPVSALCTTNYDQVQAVSSSHQDATSSQAAPADTSFPLNDHGSALHHGIYSAVYSGVAVFEMDIKGVAVMRRRSDSFMNATQILKVAGIDKGKRTKILEKEILSGQHEKVQGGYGKYQGTWIPYFRANQLAETYNVKDDLMPMLQFDPPIPGTAPVFNNRECTAKLSRDQLRTIKTEASGDKPVKRQKRRHVPTEKLFSSLPFGRNLSESSPDYLSMRIPATNINIYRPETFRDSLLKLFQPQISEQGAGSAQAAMRDLESENGMRLLTCPPPELDINITLDAEGNTALHYACINGDADIVASILAIGDSYTGGHPGCRGPAPANPSVQNYQAETALMCAVQHTHCYHAHSFADIVKLLLSTDGDTNSIAARIDSRGRSVLHHIMLLAASASTTSTLPSLDSETQEHPEAGTLAAPYYLECLLERIALTTQDFSFIDQRDRNGDTPLNIAARIGHANLVHQLVHVGAQPHVENHAGLRPVDFGLEYILGAPGLSTPADYMEESGISEVQESDYVAPNVEVEEGFVDSPLPIVLQDESHEHAMDESIVKHHLDSLSSANGDPDAMHDSHWCPEKYCVPRSGGSLSVDELAPSSRFSAKIVYAPTPTNVQDEAEYARFLGNPGDGLTEDGKSLESRLSWTHAAINEKLKGKSRDLSQAVHAMVEQVRNEYDSELSKKVSMLSDAQANIRQMAQKLAQLRKANSVIKVENSKIPALMLRIQSLERLLAQEIACRYQDDSDGVPAPQESQEGDSYNGEREKKMLEGLPPRERKMMEQALAVHRQVEESLRRQVVRLKSATSESELKFRKIIGACAGIPDESVDEMMDSLMAAIESDDACSVNVTQLSNFMNTVGKH